MPRRPDGGRRDDARRWAGSNDERRHLGWRLRSDDGWGDGAHALMPLPEPRMNDAISRPGSVNRGPAGVAATQSIRSAPNLMSGLPLRPRSLVIDGGSRTVRDVTVTPGRA